MVENRKLFYAISLMLLTCCQIITMLPHNAANSESAAAAITYLSSSRDNSENKSAKMLQETKNYTSSKNNDNSDFLIIAAGRRQQEKQQTITTSKEGVWEAQENDSRPTDNIDDLIFLDKRPINQHHHHHQQQEEKVQVQQQHEKYLHQHHSPDQSPHHHHHRNQQEQQLQNEQNQFEFHHITMDGDGDGDGGGGNSNSNANSASNEDDTDSLTDTTYSSLIVVVDDEDNAGDDDDDDVDDDDNVDGVPHEIELQPDINEEVTFLNVTPLDLSDFLSLIPASKVKAIVNHYYHNDPEVQRAHAFMSSRDFLMLKQHIIAVPEMSAFLQYLNNSGLDLVKFVTALTNLTSYDNSDTVMAMNSPTNFTEPTIFTTTPAQTAEDYTTTKFTERGENIEYAIKQGDKITPTISNIEIQITTNMPITAPTTTNAASLELTIDDIEATTTKEQLNGLHGLVDSVLDVLPQDQILATFFDKLEANEQFSKLVDTIGRPEFAKILNNMQNSLPLRNLIFTLHNNGIYVIRIVDSLKSYFFLGGF